MISGVSQTNLHYEPNLEPKRHNPKLLQFQAFQPSSEVKFNLQNSELVATIDDKKPATGKAMDSATSEADAKN